MPFAAFAVAFLILSAAIASSDASADPTKPVLVRSQSANVILALDDEVYGDRDDGDDEGAQPDDHEPSYGDDDDGDSDNDSANGPDDDDDGWDVDPLNRSERA